MAPYSVTYKNSAAKTLRKLDRQYQQAIITAIGDLAKEPRPYGAKKLQGGRGEYRLRVGSYRVIYEIQDQKLIILVLTIGHRREVYQIHKQAE